MLLNPFEIKAEILNIIEDCKDENDTRILQQRVSRLDNQPDVTTIEKILFKELMLQGIISICLQESPTILEEKLLAYTKSHDRGQI